MDSIQQEATPCVIEACGGADEARMSYPSNHSLPHHSLWPKKSNTLLVKVVEEVKEVCKSIGA